MEPPDYELYETILGQAKSRVESWGGELILVYLPGVWHFGRGASSLDPRIAETRERVKELASSLELRMIDVKAAMQAHDDPLSLYSYRGSSVLGSPHMNADGYAFTAEIVFEHLGQ